MKATVKWLKEYVDFDLSAPELGEILTMAGLEVESITYLAPDKVVAARVESVSPHPNADRLFLCSVNDGREFHQIVCGASNMKPGDIAVLALAGAKLPETAVFPEGLTIKRAKIRGSESSGMLCSEQELGISSGAPDGGVMILPGSVAPGTPVSDIAGMEDVVIEVAVTPNRPDCLSVIGIAREIAVATGGVLKVPQIPPACGSRNGGFSVSVEEPGLCPHYCCGLVEGIAVGASPLWLRARLSACGIKSVNNVVDITNLVLLEYGQPLHVFDRDLVKGGLKVRKALPGEFLQALDSEKYELDSKDLVIADDSGPVAIAGIMGGMQSSVNEKTKNVLLEAAYFNPSTVRSSSRRLKLSSESSYRFERGVDPAAAPVALQRASSLINSVAGGSELKIFSRACAREIKPREVEVSLGKTWKALGTASDARETENLLSALGFEVLESGETLRLKVPTFRPDVSRPADVVEEIARLVGYNSIPKAEPKVSLLARKTDPADSAGGTIKNVFIFGGFSEAVNYGFDSPELLRNFCSGEAVEVVNPISNDLSVMRCTLLAGLMRNLKFNLARQQRGVRLFEMGTVFSHRGKGQLPREEKFFSAVASAEGEAGLWKGGAFDFFDMKGLFERSARALFSGSGGSADSLVFQSGSDKKYFHPGKSATLFLEDGTRLGNIGEIHPRTAAVFDLEPPVALEINFEKLYLYCRGRERSFSPLPRFPSLKRDLAFLVRKDLEIANIVSGVKDTSPLVERVWVFDLFEDDAWAGMKSVGISMLLRSADKTLTDEEANSVCEKAARRLGDSFGAQVRQ